ncbi:MAG: MiaB/RimO family radical SAM methylthiotransferase [Vicinamibacterales bacterium]
MSPKPFVRYAVVTFGCRVNQADSLRIEEDLLGRGAVASTAADADLVIVNTCSVTATADQGARQTIRRISRDNPSARIVVTGCYATRAAADVAVLPNVVRVVANPDKLALVDDWFASSSELTTAERFAGADGPCGAPIAPGFAGRTAFTLRVQTGCEERCAYCIIPTTRGYGRSLPIRAVVREVERIAAAGFREVAITGVHLGSYGRDLTPAASLLDLLRALDASPADVTYRVSSLEPMDCSPEIVSLVAGSGGRFAPHFHLPLQHASDPLLARMRRPYTLSEYRRLVDGIVDRLPHASIGSDLIVGFPGESEEDFAANEAYLPSSPLSHLHVFPYSDRPGTEASTMGGRVTPTAIRVRGARLRQIGAALAQRFRAAQVGTVRPGLTLEDGTLVVTDNYLKVRVPAGRARNERVSVRIDEADGVVTGTIA